MVRSPSMAAAAGIGRSRRSATVRLRVLGTGVGTEEGARRLRSGSDGFEGSAPSGVTSARDGSRSDVAAGEARPSGALRGIRARSASDQLCAGSGRARRPGPATREIGVGSTPDALWAGAALDALRAGSALDQRCAGCMRAAGWVRSARPPTVRPARRAGPARWNRRCCRSVMQPAHGSHEPMVAFRSAMHPANGYQEAAVAFRSAMHPVHGSHAPTVAFGSGMHPANGCQEAAVAFGSDMHPVHGCPRSAGRRSLRRAEPSTGRGRAPDPRPARAAPGPTSDADHA
jgi:hypothetical protein